MANQNRYILSDTSLTPAGFVPQEFTPKQANLGYLNDSLKNIEQRGIAARQQQSAVLKALGDVKLNAAEDEWKIQKAQEIQDTGQAMINMGDLGGALTYYISEAGKLASDQELKAKEEENKNFEDWQKSVDALYMNNKIQKDTRDYFLDKVKYKFSGKYDEFGNFKGHNLTEYSRPVQDVELSGLFSWVGNVVAEQAGSSQGLGGVDSKGNKLNYYDKDSSMIAHTGIQWHRKDASVLKGVWDEAVKRHPQLIAAMEQQMDVNQWLLDKKEKELDNVNLTPEERNKINSEITRLRNDLYENGDLSKPYTAQQYLMSCSEKTINAQAYNRVGTTISATANSGSGSGGTSFGWNWGMIGFNVSQPGPSGLIKNSLLNHLNNTVISVGTGYDVQTALNK